MDKFTSALLAAVSIALILAGPAYAAEPRVALPQGLVEGRAAEAVEEFRNIPFAAAPVGALRFRPPQEAPYWSGVRAYDPTRIACPQIETRMIRLDRVQEDCLYLNVWRPQAPAAAPLPVIVWVHGGAYIQSSGANPMFDGDALARKGVIVVTFNYRIGPLGFIAHPELQAEAESLGEPSANYGLMDQIAALEWVRDHIAAFGGDPANITVMGESAGGGSVRALMTSPPARGLFQKAVIMSGVSGFQWPTPEEVIAARAPTSPLARPLAELRALPWQAFVEGIRNAAKTGEPAIQPPLIDGTILPEDPGAAFAAGRQARVPLMLGTTSDEASLIRLFVRDIDEAVTELLGPETTRLKAIYDPSSVMDTKQLASLWVGDYTQVEPTRRDARRHAALGAPTYHYHFGYVAERLAGRMDGAPHGGELVFLFDSAHSLPRALRRLGTDRDAAVSTRMMDLWTGFAKTGTPGSGWAPFAPGRETTLTITKDGAFLPAIDYRKAELDYWEAFTPLAIPR